MRLTTMDGPIACLAQQFGEHGRMVGASDASDRADAIAVPRRGYTG